MRGKNGRAWTIPTNALSVLKLLSPQSEPDGLVITWQSVSGQLYDLERAIDGTGSLSILRSGILGQAGLTSVTDTNFDGVTSSIYRVAVP